MKEKIITFVKNNWRYIVVAGVAIAATAVVIGCGSTWRISDNTVTVEVMKCDTTVHLKKGSKIIKNDNTNSEQMGQIPEETMEPEM